MIQIKLNERVRNNFLQVRQEIINHQIEMKRLESLLQASAMSIALNDDSFVEGMDISLSADCDQLIIQENERKTEENN